MSWLLWIGDYIVSGFVTLYQTVIQYPTRSIIAAGLLATHLTAFWGGVWAVRDDFSEGQGVTTVGEKKASKSLSELLRPTVPDRFNFAPKPDTNVVDTVKTVVPKYITKRDTVFRFMDRIKSEITFSEPSITLETALQGINQGFIAVPVVDGNPTISVSSRRTLVEAFNPEDGRNFTIRYDHPRDNWKIGPLASVQFIGRDVETQGMLGGYVKYKDVRLSGGYNFSPVEEITGLTVGIEYSPKLTGLFN